MKIFLSLNLDSRVCGWSTARGNDRDIEIEVPSDHEVLNNPMIFKCESGVLIKDEAYQQKLIKEREEQRNKLSVNEEIQELKKSSADLAFELLVKGVI